VARRKARVTHQVAQKLQVVGHTQQLRACRTRQGEACACMRQVCSATCMWHMCAVARRALRTHAQACKGSAAHNSEAAKEQLQRRHPPASASFILATAASRVGANTMSLASSES
jgi:hypothetical protein